MKYMYPNYYDIDNWIILDNSVIHMYNDQETPINILKVKIGILDIEEVGLNNKYNKRSLDIIRWITKQEFDRLRAGSGVIVW